MSSKKVTIRDVAAASGYSIYAVSRALNHKGDLNAETARRIRQVAQELRYNILGNVVAARQVATHSLGIVLPHSGSLLHTFYNRAVCTLRALATENSLDCQLYTEWDILRKLDLERGGGIHSLGCRGLVVFCPQGKYAEYVPALLRQGVAVALVRRRLRARPGLFQARDNDQVEIGRLLEHIYTERGCRRLVLMNGFRAGPGRVPTRAAGFREFSRTHPEAAATLVLPARVWEKSLNRLVKFVQAGDPVREGPPAVLCWSDGCAQTLVSALHQRGLSVPRDVLVAGYNGDPWTSESVPPLTTMHIPVEAMVAAATRYLLSYSGEGKLPPAQTADFSHEIVLRESTGAV